VRENKKRATLPPTTPAAAHRRNQQTASHCTRTTHSWLHTTRARGEEHSDIPFFKGGKSAHAGLGVLHELGEQEGEGVQRHIPAAPRAYTGIQDTRSAHHTRGRPLPTRPVRTHSFLSGVGVWELVLCRRKYYVSNIPLLQWKSYYSASWLYLVRTSAIVPEARVARRSKSVCTRVFACAFVCVRMHVGVCVCVCVCVCV
jgi:hypothetical protein